MLTISSTPSTNTTPVLKTGPELFTVVSHWIGITNNGILTFHAKIHSKTPPTFQTQSPTHPQHSPYQAPPKTYGAASQDPMPMDTTNKLNEPRIKNIQRVVGAILYYARAVDHTDITALSSVAGDQENATEQTGYQSQQLLDCLTTHPCTTIRYYASESAYLYRC